MIVIMIVLTNLLNVAYAVVSILFVNEYLSNMATVLHMVIIAKSAIVLVLSVPIWVVWAKVYDVYFCVKEIYDEKRIIEKEREK